MGKFKRGGFIFLTWKGDHVPEHVHVYKNGRLILKWDLEKWELLAGRASRRLRTILESLRQEGLL